MAIRFASICGLVFAATLLGRSPTAWADEKPREQLGELKIDSLVLRPQFSMTEGGGNNFSLGESLFAVRWRMDTHISGVFAVGSQDLLGTTQLYTPTLSENLGFVEAYGEYTGAYGTFRAGLQPLNFGLDGGVSEEDLDIHRSMLFSERLVALRDIGVSYRIKNNGFFTSVMVHNGESGPNVDNRAWYTANWGWTDDYRLRLGVAGQTGTTKPESTLATGD